ncbi:DUF6261 family protein [Alistipes sp. ZOR0009]|uniref:DUF6261 family protein n=1 Tax=Alistipes sp. ZOR0009 TaxID=1339253 RepID=UPI000647DD38|nr:DUF6261 family protein [Alistipes sp. ZOR0009]
MTRILQVNLSRLQVKELGSLAAFLIAKLTVLVTGKHVPQKMVDTITEIKADFDGAVGSSANPEQTKELHAKDALCDASFQELKGLATAASLRRDESISSAGERVLTAIRHRGFNMQKFRIPVQVDAMNQLLGDLAEPATLKIDVATIDATEVVARLKTEVTDLGDTWQHIQEGKSADSLTSIEATRRLRASVVQVFKYLDSVSDYEPEVAAAIEQINGAIAPFATTLKSRATIRENKKDDDKKISK